MIIEMIKKIIPLKLKCIYRLNGKGYYYYKRICQLRNLSNYSLLIGTPVHENLGDHLIAFSELHLLKDTVNSEIIEIPIEAYKLFKHKLLEYIKPDVTLYVQGGGWMGTVWPNDELLMQDILITFHKNKTIVFPQTAYFEPEKKYRYLMENGKNVYARDNLLICLREKKSYDIIQILFPSLNILLQPDVSLYLKNKLIIEKNIDKTKVGICFRNDREEVGRDLKNRILHYLKECNFGYELIDTLLDYHVLEENREHEILKKINEFTKFKIIITDRLHGMLFSYISDVFCIAIDNKTHKVSSVYETWLVESSMIRFVEDFEDFQVEFKNAKLAIQDDMTFDFVKMKEVIANGWNK